MDDPRSATGADGLPVCPAPSEDLPADFVPLRLVLHPGGASVELNRPEMLLGRHSEADIRLPLPDVSRRHCRFVFRDGCWHIYDLKSLNGTFINDHPVDEALVCHGDRLRVGGFTFSVDLGQGSPTGPTLAPHELVQNLLREQPSRRAS
jgi:pSer/pThr/pTyr-binding forkhead associated (FHA) protein